MQQAQLLVINEVTVGHRYLYECLNRSLQDVRSNNKSLGGLTIFFSGDWKQILPVVKRGSQAQVIDATLKKSHIWENIQTLELHFNHRVQSLQNIWNTNYADYIVEIGNGLIP